MVLSFRKVSLTTSKSSHCTGRRGHSTDQAFGEEGSRATDSTGQARLSSYLQLVPHRSVVHCVGRPPHERETPSVNVYVLIFFVRFKMGLSDAITLSNFDKPFSVPHQERILDTIRLLEYTSVHFFFSFGLLTYMIWS